MSAVQQVMLAQKIVTGGGGGSPTFVTASDSMRSDSSATLTDSVTITGSNRFTVGFMSSLAFVSPPTHTSFTVGAGGLTQQGTTQDSAGFQRSLWQGTASPTGAQTATATFSAVASQMFAGLVQYENVNQTTPRGTIYSATGNISGASGTASDTVDDCTAGDILIGVVLCKDGNTGPTSISLPGGSTFRYNPGGLIFEGLYGAIFERTASGNNETMSATLTPAVADSVDWEIYVFKLVAP